MKTAKTVLATFGLTTLFYGIFALVIVSFNPVFSGRSIFQMCRSTGFPALVLGLGCLLSVVIMTISSAAFRDESRTHGTPEDDDLFLETETVPADTYDEEWTPAIKRRERAALALERDEPETPDLFSDDAEEDEPEEPQPLDETIFQKPKAASRHCVFCGTSLSPDESVCPKCGKRA